MAKKPKGYWTKERVLEEASKYNSMIEFVRNAGGAYNVARRNGWIPDVWDANFFERQGVVDGYWTKERILEEASKYNSMVEFQRNAGGAYNTAYKNGWLPDVWNAGFFERLCKPVGFWDLEHVLEEASKYNSMVEFKRNARGAYAAARRNGWIPEVWAAGFFEQQKVVGGYWTKEHVLEEASKYSSMAEFQRNAGGAYTTAHKNGWLPDVWDANFFERQKAVDGYWTLKTILEEAAKYSSMAEFVRNARVAYAVAYRDGFLDSIWDAGFFKPMGNRYKRCIYAIKNDALKQIYIGLTYNYEQRITTHLNGSHRKEIHDLSIHEGTSITKVTDYLEAEEAAELEKLYISYFRTHPDNWDVLNVRDGGQL